MRPRLSFANVVSVFALFVALGGSAYAFHLGKHSVGSEQLKKNAVTTAKIKNETVTAGKIKAGTLTGKQIDASTLGVVPAADHAKTADESLRAMTADSVRGTPVFDSGLVSMAIPASDIDPPNEKQLFTDGPITMKASCGVSKTPSTDALIQAFSTDLPLSLIEGGTRFTQSNPPPQGLSPVVAVDPGAPFEVQQFLLSSASGTSIQGIGTAAVVSESGECLFRISAFG